MSRTTFGLTLISFCYCNVPCDVEIFLVCFHGIHSCKYKQASYWLGAIKRLLINGMQEAVFTQVA